MAQLTPDQFSKKWIPLLADNVFQNIDGPRLAQLITDIKDSFAASTAAGTVPSWKAGTYYPLGYVIQYSFNGARAILLRAKLAGYLPEPTDPAGDDNWESALSPVADNALYQLGSVAALRRERGNWVPGRLYVLTGRVDATSGDELPDVFVRAVTNEQLEPEGYTFDARAIGGQVERVRYDLATDETAPVTVDAYTPQQVDDFLHLKANLASPVFTGQPAAPTPDARDISEHLATTRFVSTALAGFYTSAYPLVCVRADGTLNFTFNQLHEAMAWAGAGGPGSGVYLNRPIAATSFVVMPAGTFLDLQRNVVDMAGWPVRMADKCEIRNNKLLYSGRIAPDFDPGYPCKQYIFGGTLACRLNYQLNTSATIVLDNVVVADFGQQSFGGVNAGPATSPYVGQKVILRNGARFDVGYPPHPNTTVTEEAPATGGGGGGGGGAPVDAYTKAESDSQRQQLEADIAAAAGTQKRTTLEFRYEAGYSDTFQCTISETMAGTYKSMGLVNTSDLAIYRNNGIAGIPLTVLAGDQIVLLINRQDLTKGASVTLTQ